jgi:hypothetical protein
VKVKRNLEAGLKVYDDREVRASTGEQSDNLKNNQYAGLRGRLTDGRARAT